MPHATLPVPSDAYACPMCVGPVPLDAIAADPNGPAARADVSRNPQCLGCYGSGRALCVGCRRGTADIELDGDHFCVLCAPAACADWDSDDSVGDECRWDEIDWAA